MNHTESSYHKHNRLHGQKTIWQTIRLHIKKNRENILYLSEVFAVEAYLFINSDPGMLWDIAETAHEIEGVKMAHAVTGQFDVVAYIEFLNMNMLRDIIEKFQALEGVQRTQTAVAIPARLA